jgi:hypothetical protein
VLFGLVHAKSSQARSFQHDDRHIAVSLRFQGLAFLADYVTMQPAPTIVNAEPVKPADIQIHDPAATQSEPVDLPLDQTVDQPLELGGRDGPEPTRFGDWEKAGRCIDF